jgi:hypothetical protein
MLSPNPIYIPSHLSLLSFAILTLLLVMYFLSVNFVLLRSRYFTEQFVYENVKKKKTAMHCTVTRFEVLTRVKMLMLSFLLVLPCGFVDRCQHLGGTSCHHLTMSKSYLLQLILMNTFPKGIINPH